MYNVHDISFHSYRMVLEWYNVSSNQIWVFGYLGISKMLQDRQESRKKRYFFSDPAMHSSSVAIFHSIFNKKLFFLSSPAFTLPLLAASLANQVDKKRCKLYYPSKSKEGSKCYTGSSLNCVYSSYETFSKNWAQYNGHPVISSIVCKTNHEMAITSHICMIQSRVEDPVLDKNRIRGSVPQTKVDL